MRPSMHRIEASAALPPHVPLLEASDLPDDDWSLPDAFRLDDGFGDDDRLATLSVARAFDD